MSVLNENTIIGASGASGGYEIDNSLRFNDNDNAYLSRTPSVAGNRKTWTWSTWVKRGNLSSTQVLFLAGNPNGTLIGDLLILMFNSADILRVDVSSISIQTTTAVYRDPSAWYHIVLSVDTTQATASDRMRLYVNGVQQAFSGGIVPQNADLAVNNTVAQNYGKYNGSTLAFDGYLSEVNFIDGLALTPDSFGELGDYGEWKPLAYTGAYGTNGFYLDFKNSGDLGNDVSGNANDWTPTNLAATDQMLDSPTNNFANFNILAKHGAADPDGTFTEGNCEVTNGSGSGSVNTSSSIASSTGKWYSEVLVNTVGSGVLLGMSQPASYSDLFYMSQAGTISGLTITSGAIASFIAGDIIGLAVDLDASTVTYYKNGVSLFIATFTDISESRVFWNQHGTSSASTFINFGQDSSFAGNKTAQGNSDANGIGDFYYAPPTGFLALCTQNLPEPTVVPSEHFNTLLYTGNATARSITGVGFQSDFTWIKNRSATQSHNVFDAVRGEGKLIYPNITNAEATTANHLTSFDADGFTIGGATSANGSGNNIVAWNWKANGVGASNTDGSITSTVSANVDAGFSIIGYTGTGSASIETVGHGLSVAPELVISKNLASVKNWFVTTDAVDGSFDSLELNLTSAKVNRSGIFATASTFSILNGSVTNENSSAFISYAFHSIDGYSKVGSYTGNGSADGTFVHCGFRPAYVMVKRTDAAGSNWFIYDGKRDAYNVTKKYLIANDSTTEGAANGDFDLLSNGFKPRNSTVTLNGSGNNFIFLAFAESPFKYSNAR